MDFKKFKDDLLFVPLGGSNEIGMNLNLYHFGGKWLMVDCGIGFAGEYLPGVDIVVPDVSFIAERKADLVGLVVTHAHEDHVGAIPYVWREFGCPIYTTPFTAAFLRHKVNEMGPGTKPKIIEMQPGSKIDIAPFGIELVQLTHSIPEMQAVAITTPKGIVLHTGDWKFDDEPLVGPVSDVAALKRYGDQGILAMVCDSTNVFVDGASGSEGAVHDALIEAIKGCKERVLVSTFASNFARVKTIIEAAEATGRVVALAGRSLHRVVETARESGYLSKDVELISDREAMNLPRKDVVIIATGCQGEPRAALSRIARGDHPTIRLSPGDAVIFSSRKIPGNESRVNWMHNALVSKKIEVITEKDHFIHVSGHPARDELKKMYALVRPQIAVPTHGEARHLHEHCKFARLQGVKETVEAKNGAVIWLEPNEASVLDHVPSGYVAVDGLSLIPTDGEIIRTRRKLRDDGIVIISAAIDENRQLAGELQLSAPGVLDAEEDAELIEELVDELTRIVETAPKKAKPADIKESLRLAARKLIKNELDKKPVIEVMLLAV
ncbi:MAG: ribonuclease J [Alphaproteobacteria bacterium]|nr:ribonuclease J [Alphaproteobacteria bacterium]